MEVRVIAFASAADALGTGDQRVEVPEGSLLGELVERLESEHPRLAGLRPRLAVAVEGEVVPLTTPLSEGAEVALLPPVSGGSPEDGPSAVVEAGRARLTEEPLTASAMAEIVALVTSSGRGAVLSFVGTVRDRHDGRPVSYLVYTAYETMAERRLATIVADLERAEPGLAAAIVHRLGEVPAGEASVAIVVASPHRDAAYHASREALERLKREVPIWKREHYADGEAAWREEEALAPAPSATTVPSS